jgi:hypothetical protein
MVRLVVAALLVTGLLGCASPPSSSPGKDAAATLDHDCNSPGETPICAAKTYHICTAYGDQDLCRKVGNSSFAIGRNVRKDLPALEAEPWRLTWEQVADRQKYCGLYVAADRDVDADRFSALPPIRSRLKGSREVVLVIDATCLKIGGYDVESIFLNKSAQGWEVVSIDDWSIENPEDKQSIRQSVCLSSEYGPGNKYCTDFHAAGIAPYRPEEIMGQRWRLMGRAQAVLPTVVSNPVWSIDVADSKGVALGNATFELTDEKVETCMSGSWMRARLKSSTFKSYPLEQWYAGRSFAAYKLSAGKEKGKPKIALMLNAPICDSYLFLTGDYTEKQGSGDYYSLGLGSSSDLGTFTAQRK